MHDVKNSDCKFRYLKVRSLPDNWNTKMAFLVCSDLSRKTIQFFNEKKING